MEAINTEMLSALLDLLVESGVEEFEGAGIHVRFTETLFTPDRRVEEDKADSQDFVEKPAPRTMWEVPTLWPGGEPPKFPGK